MNTNLMTDLNIPLEELLATLKHPTVYHIKAGVHPGETWWLKTICPDPRLVKLDQEGLGSLWLDLTDRFRHIVHLTDIAFDWYGSKISNTWTVWLDQKVDIVVKSTADVLFLDRHEGELLAAEQIRNDEILGKNTNLLYAAEEFEQIYRQKNAKNIRNKFKVI